MKRCRPGFFDIDGRSSNGCEYGCTVDLEAPEERCDGQDNNCNGQIDEGLEYTWYQDLDNDGYGETAEAVESCLRPEGYVSRNGDCDDNNPERHPERIETCDDVDNDCDEIIDEDAQRPYYIDSDGDGYGNPNQSTIRCTPEEGEVLDGTDCDDSTADRHPGKLEVCDDKDNNCTDGLEDEPYQTFYQDDDNDGWGVTTLVVKACRRPEGYALDGGDCDDENNANHPGADEICDGVDNDCDTVVDEDLPLVALYPDADEDGWGALNGVAVQACVGTPNRAPSPQDCDDNDPNRHPGAAEWCDGVDQDCDLNPDNDLSVRHEASNEIAALAGSLETLCIDSTEVRWSERLAGVETLQINRLNLDGGGVLRMNDAGDQAPLRLPDYGAQKGLIGVSGTSCRIQTADGDAWSPLGISGCRPLAVCPHVPGGQQNFWSVLLGLSNGGVETAYLYSIDRQGNVQRLETLMTVTAFTQAQCGSGGYFALAGMLNAEENLYAGPAPTPQLRSYNNRIQSLDLHLNPGATALLAISRSDGVVEVEALSAQGASVQRQIVVGQPKEAGHARFIPAPTGVVLAYPVVAPIFERGVWATPLDANGAPNGAQQRLTDEGLSNGIASMLPSNTAGMGQLVYATSTGLNLMELGCAPP
jgi:hypothetical protein